MKTKTKPLKGAKLARAALTYIIEHPKEWCQTIAPNPGGCGCFIHHVCRIGRIELNSVPGNGLVKRCIKRLQISEFDFFMLYRNINNINDLKRLCKEMFGISIK